MGGGAKIVGIENWGAEQSIVNNTALYDHFYNLSL